MTMTMAGGVGGGPGTWNIYMYVRTCHIYNFDGEAFPPLVGQTNDDLLKL